MFLDRAMVVIHRLWQKPFRFITTHSTQCTLPDRAAGHHTNLHVPQSSDMYGSIQSPVVRDSALGFLPAHFGLFALNFFSLILIEESNYLVLFLHFLFKYIKNFNCLLMRWTEPLPQTFQDIWRLCSKWSLFYFLLKASISSSLVITKVVILVLTSRCFVSIYVYGKL